MIHRSPSASHRFSIVQGINSFSEVAELLRNSVSVSGRLCLAVCFWSSAFTQSVGVESRSDSTTKGVPPQTAPSPTPSECQLPTPIVLCASCFSVRTRMQRGLLASHRSSLKFLPREVQEDWS
jgi:hypothetical protein